MIDTIFQQNKNFHAKKKKVYPHHVSDERRIEILAIAGLLREIRSTGIHYIVDKC